MTPNRVGLGVDIHGRGEGGALFLGGVRFEGEPRLAGHSDADVICHAVADALLGAAGLGDLGEHFPDSDPAFEDLGGLELLARVMALLSERRFAVEACDLTVIADSPAIAPHRADIRRNLAAALAVPPEHVSVKATRPEGLGLTGDGAACLAIAVVGESPEG